MRRALPVPVVGGRATLVGERTYGKGVVQALQPVPDAGVLILTAARHLTAVGSDISGVGVLPRPVVCETGTTPGDAALNPTVEVVTSR